VLTGLLVRPLLVMLLAAIARTPLRFAVTAPRHMVWLHAKAK